MELVDKVVIGTVTYAVQEVTDLHIVGENGEKKLLNGHIIYGESVIKVDRYHSPDMKVVVTWHEVLHGLLDQAGVEDHPEDVVRALGYGLVRLIRDNPALVAMTVGEGDKAQ